MQYTQLGRTGLTVSRLCLGTMNFGTVTSPEDSFAVMDQALDLGINFFDTADVYGKSLGEGITEGIIGQWLANGGRREKIVLATKVFGPMGHSPLDRGLSARHIRRACDESLRRLQTDHIDLYQMHHVDRGTTPDAVVRLLGVEQADHRFLIDHGPPWEEIWQAIEQLVTAGKVLYVGSSNFAAWNIARATTLATARNSLGLVSEQSKYSLACRTAELEVVPACRGLGLGLIPWSPLDGGMLAGVLQKLTEGRRANYSADKIAKYRPQLEAYDTLCKELGETPADVALAWLLANPVVTAPIIGPRTRQQLTDSLRALSVELSAEVLAKLDEIWPGPGGEAPEAYAW
ncbi:MAG: aldo/keto reductase [Candidatus Nealsonbacteria bacterium]|nr:aldo/keto reductase [Candidatus Nealsonbacteria bacterium]